MRGQDLRTLMPDSGAAEAVIEAVRAGRHWTGEIKARRQDGAEFYVQVSAAGNRDADDQLVGVVLSFLDISDRRRADEAELQSERQRVMMESLGAACHHLGQPSTVLLSCLELMQRVKDTDRGAMQELLDSSVTAAESLRLMLHELNDLTEYRTRPYMEGDDPTGGTTAPRIVAVQPAS